MRPSSHAIIGVTITWLLAGTSLTGSGISNAHGKLDIYILASSSVYNLTDPNQFLELAFSKVTGTVHHQFEYNKIPRSTIHYTATHLDFTAQVLLIDTSVTPVTGTVQFQLNTADDNHHIHARAAAASTATPDHHLFLQYTSQQQTEAQQLHVTLERRREQLAVQRQRRQARDLSSYVIDTEYVDPGYVAVPVGSVEECASTCNGYVAGKMTKSFKFSQFCFRSVGLCNAFTFSTTYGHYNCRLCVSADLNWATTASSTRYLVGALSGCSTTAALSNVTLTACTRRACAPGFTGPDCSARILFQNTRFETVADVVVTTESPLACASACDR